MAKTLQIHGVWYLCDPSVLCSGCGFRGLLLKHERPDRITDAFEPAYVRDTLECPTCIDTPSGIDSENRRHKRFPDSEYQLDKENKPNETKT